MLLEQQRKAKIIYTSQLDCAGKDDIEYMRE